MLVWEISPASQGPGSFMTSWGLASCSDEIDSVWRNCYLLRSWRGPSDVSALVWLMGKSNISPPALFRRTCSWKPTWKWPTVLLFVLGGMKPQWQWTETLVKFKILIWDVCTQPRRIIIDHLKFTRKMKPSNEQGQSFGLLVLGAPTGNRQISCSLAGLGMAGGGE